MKYILKQIDPYTPSEITVDFTTDGLDSVLQHFEQFLRGCGFHFEGTLDIIPPEEYTSNEDEDVNHSDYYFDFDRNKSVVAGSMDDTMSFDLGAAQPTLSIYDEFDFGKINISLTDIHTNEDRN